MIKIGFDEQEISVPESWADICLGDYERWLMVTPQNKAEQVALVADICGIDAAVLLNNPTQLFDVIVQTVSFVFNDFEGDVCNSLDIEGTPYTVVDTEQITLAEWVDVESVMESDTEHRLSEILAIICRPTGEVYDSNLSLNRRELFAQLTMDKVMPMLAFFLRRRETLQTALNHFSDLRAEVDQYLHLIQNFVENGDGTKSLPIWQRIKYYYLTKSLKKRLSKCSVSYSIS